MTLESTLSSSQTHGFPSNLAAKTTSMRSSHVQCMKHPQKYENTSAWREACQRDTGELFKCNFLNEAFDSVSDMPKINFLCCVSCDGVKVPIT